MEDNLGFDPVEFEIDFAAYVNMVCDHLDYHAAREKAIKEYKEYHETDRL